jgi:hypothetical protein
LKPYVELQGDIGSVSFSLRQLEECGVLPPQSSGDHYFARWEVETEAEANEVYSILKRSLQGKEFVVRLEIP